jgi:hypothetical protein
MSVAYVRVRTKIRNIRDNRVRVRIRTHVMYNVHVRDTKSCVRVRVRGVSMSVSVFGHASWLHVRVRDMKY